MIKKLLVFAAAFMLLVPAFSQEEKKDNRTVDEKINDAVKPVADAVTNVVFYSFHLREDVRYANVFKTVDGKDSIKYTDTPPFEVTYEAEKGLNYGTVYSIVPQNEDAFDLYLAQGGMSTHKYGEKITITDSVNGELAPIVFTVNKTGKMDPEMRYHFQVAETTVPFVLIWLLLGAIVFTFFFRFVNVTHFKMAIDIVRGKYSDPNEKGEVSHFQALTAALSATVGLGNIAGVAVAITVGGPGATFWMITAGLLGMSSKFVECTLGVKFREIGEDGKVYGGPMYYLSKGLAERGLEKLGKVFAVFFAIMCIGGSFGGGNMFQVNQAFKQLDGITQSPVEQSAIGADMVDAMIYDNDNNLAEYKVLEVNDKDVKVISSREADDASKAITVAKAEVTERFVNRPMNGMGWLFGLIIAGLVAIVIIGGIKSIAKVTDKIVPFMVAIYVAAALIVIFVNIDQLGFAFGEIFSGAFSPDAIGGGIIGVLIAGFQRAAFSNEAGIGSASIAHSAVKTDNPASEGLVALLEPFIDTVVVCTMTAIVIIITGKYQDTSLNDGIALTSSAFESVISWFPYILAGAVLLFAFSTMISWSYYGQQAWSYLFGRGKGADISYKVVFCFFVVLGASMTLGPVIGFSDAMIFAMCFPNVFGLYFLLPVVKKELNKYVGKIKSGEIITQK